MRRNQALSRVSAAVAVGGAIAAAALAGAVTANAAPDGVTVDTQPPAVIGYDGTSPDFPVIVHNPGTARTADLALDLSPARDLYSVNSFELSRQNATTGAWSPVPLTKDAAGMHARISGVGLAAGDTTLRLRINNVSHPGDGGYDDTVAFGLRTTVVSGDTDLAADYDFVGLKFPYVQITKFPATAKAGTPVRVDATVSNATDSAYPKIRPQFGLGPMPGISHGDQVKVDWRNPATGGWEPVNVFYAPNDGVIGEFSDTQLASVPARGTATIQLRVTVNNTGIAPVEVSIHPHTGLRLGGDIVNVTMS
jgi:hypothetical protein